MDYSSQDSNPIDFSKSNKDLVHNKVPNTLHVTDEEMERRVIPVVRLNHASCSEMLNFDEIFPFFFRTKMKTTTQIPIIVRMQHQLSI